jgi:hypothetical protein
MSLYMKILKRHPFSSQSIISATSPSQPFTPPRTILELDDMDLFGPTSKTPRLTYEDGTTRRYGMRSDVVGRNSWTTLTTSGNTTLTTSGKRRDILNRESNLQGVIPTLKTAHRIFDDDKEKSRVLLEVFFPLLPEMRKEPQMAMQQLVSLLVEPITLQEIELALIKMSSWKAPRQDRLPVAIWQQIWPAVKCWVIKIFQASIQLSYFTNLWRVAKIVVLPKGGDPSLPKSYCPISLLATLGKGLEAVIANRVSALVKNISSYL